MLDSEINGLTAFAFTILIAFVSFVWYIDSFRKIEFHDDVIGPFKFVHRIEMGPYEQNGALFKSVVKYIAKFDLEHCKTAGICYDDPQNPRYAFGFIIEKNDEEKFNSMKEKIQGWKIMEIKETKTAASYFPIKFQTISRSLSARKTYSAFNRQEKYKSGSGIMEIYDEEKIETHFPQSNLLQFWPPSSN